MAYWNSVTRAAREEINRYVDKLLFESSSRLDRQRTADEVMGLLMDDTTLCTPGFVLRRHIQAAGLVRPDGCADLRKSRNVPWPKEAVEQAASELSSLCYHTDGKRWAVSKENWTRYLTDSGSQGIQRRMIFRLAIAVGMDHRQTIELLLACDQAPYNVRNPLELTCWFYQALPALCRWSLVQEQMEEWEKSRSVQPKSEADPPAYDAPAEGDTDLLRQQVEELLRELDASRAAKEAGERFLALLTENYGRLMGYSRTAQSAYLRLADGLSILYGAEEGCLTRLIAAMYEHHQWDFDTLLQNLCGERYVFRGFRGDGYAEQLENIRLDRVLGRAAMYAKQYPARAGKIRRGAVGVDRQDVLFLGYFLITGYIDADEQTAARFQQHVIAGQEPLREKEPQSGKELLDQGMIRLMPHLERLRRRPAARQKFDLCRLALNQLLSVFDFHAIYYPAPFDRFVLLSLLTDKPAWTMYYLFGGEDEIL